MVQDSFLLFILLIHFIADFTLQTSEQAENKSSNNLLLFYHVGTYSIAWFIAAWMFLPFPFAFIFASTTFICHFLTDYVTSRLAKKFFDKKDYHNGFVVVGFDQLLHYVQLWLTFKFLLG
jgi:hypothetical protein